MVRVSSDPGHHVHVFVGNLLLPGGEGAASFREALPPAAGTPGRRSMSGLNTERPG